jgi:amidase
MAVRRPTLDQLRSVAEDLGMHMGEEELKSYDGLLQANYAAYDAVDAMPDYVPAVKYPRTPGYRPEGEENKFNAWYVKTTVKGAPSGKLPRSLAAARRPCPATISPSSAIRIGLLKPKRVMDAAICLI